MTVALVRLALLLPLAACSPDPLLATRVVPFALTLDSTKAVGSTVCGDSISVKDNMDGIFERFLRDTRQALGGRDPARITVDEITLYADEGPGFAPLAKSFGTFDISLVIDSPSHTVTLVELDHSQVKLGDYPTLPVSFDSHLQLTDAQWAAMLGTLFRVRICGQATPYYLQESHYFHLHLQLRFTSYDR